MPTWNSNAQLILTRQTSDDSCDIFGLCLHKRDTFFRTMFIPQETQSDAVKSTWKKVHDMYECKPRSVMSRMSDANSDDDHRATRTRTRFDTFSYEPRDTLGRADNHHNPIYSRNSTLNNEIYKTSDADATFKRALVRVHDISITNNWYYKTIDTCNLHDTRKWEPIIDTKGWFTCNLRNAATFRLCTRNWI